MPKITPFVGGPLDGQTTTGRGNYRDAQTGEHVGTSKGDRALLIGRYRRATAEWYDRLRSLYVRRGDEYHWGFDSVRRMLTESRARTGLPPIEENDHLSARLLDGTEVAGTVVDVWTNNVYLRATPRSPEVKVEWPLVVEWTITAVCGLTETSRADGADTRADAGIPRSA